MSSTSPLASPTTATAPTTNAATAAIDMDCHPNKSSGSSKCASNRTPTAFGRWQTMQQQAALPSMRTLGVGVFAALVGVFCILTVRHLTFAFSPVVVGAVPSAVALPLSLPDPSVQQQLAMPPTTMVITDQLDALRYRLAQLQNAIVDLQQQQQISTGIGNAGVAGGVQQSVGMAANQQQQQQQQEQQQQQQVWPFHQRQMARRAMAWQPLRKRMVSWQPMKRGASWQPVKRAGNGGDEAREQVMLAIEDQLMEVLQAGERLGISTVEILAHLRARNGWDAVPMEPGM